MVKRKGAKLGQHFLIHSWAARALAHAAAPRPGEKIVEIGPGKGVLTRELLALGDVLAIEKDPILCEKLRATFAPEIASGRLHLIEGDVRDFDPHYVLRSTNYVLMANIPYYITGEIIRQFLTSAHPPRTMALLVQKEVAQRIVGRGQGTRDSGSKESILSLSVKAYGRPRIVEKVSRKHFSPPPSVDSAILLIEDISKNFFASTREEDFFDIVHAGFASKRKLLSNNLSVRYPREEVLRAMQLCGIAEKSRAENVALETWRSLAMHLLPR